MTDDRLSLLQRQAEMEMRRVLDTSRPRKRHRGPSGDTVSTFVPIDRFRYAVVKELEAGAKGFIVTCNFRREKSATREASQLLRRYMPSHLFPLPFEPKSTGGQSQGHQELGAEPAGKSKCNASAALEVHGSPEPRDIGVAGSEHAVTLAQTAGESAQTTGSGGALATVEGNINHKTNSNSDSGSDGEEESDGGGDPDHQDGGAEGVGAREPGGDTTGADAEPSALALAKVGCRGVVVMRLSAAAAAEVDPVVVVGRMLADLAAGTLQAPRHCQRIIPLDATALLTANGLSAAVSAAAAAYKLRQPTAGAGEPFSYAVVYHSRATETRGTAGAAAAGPPPRAGDAAACPESSSTKDVNGRRVEDGGADASEQLSDRGRVIAQVAAGMAAAFGPAARVNLKQPQVGVLVEAFPIAGRQFAGLALLPESMMVIKGRLGVKPLAKNAPAH